MSPPVIKNHLTSEAVGYAKANRFALAFLDIEMVDVSGLDVCRELLEVNPHTNVVYLTSLTGGGD
ncbi:MAG: response regulator [Clostridia bacterium]|nr:response regulator [Clostridia bacterium]